MTAADLFREARSRGVELLESAGELRYRAPRGALTERLRAELSAHREELLDLLSSATELCSPDDVEQVLADATVAAAIFHSRALGRDFVLARDEAALDALTEPDRALPVLFFTECDELAKLGVEGLRAVLEVRAAFGLSTPIRFVAQRSSP